MPGRRDVQTYVAVGGGERDSHWLVPPYTLATVSLATRPGTYTADYDCLRLTCTILRQHDLEDIHTTN